MERILKVKTLREKMIQKIKKTTHRRKIQQGKVEGGVNIRRRTKWRRKMTMMRKL